jgi:drug/metabolite transporter (DMT)-like permease
MESSVAGFSCLALWVVVSAGARILAHGVLARLSPFVVCFHVFLTAQLFFLLLNARRLWSKRAGLRNRWAVLALLNLSAIGAWYGSLFPLKYLPPTLVSSSVAACSPLFALLLSMKRGPGAKPLGRDIPFAAILFGLGSFLFWTERNSAGWLPAMIWCLIASFSIAATALLSKSLALPAGESLSVRFWGLILFSWAGCRLSGESLVPGGSAVAPLLELAVLYGVLPLYLIQVGINLLEPLTITTAMPFIPLTIFALEAGLGGAKYPIGIQAAVGAIFLVSIAAVARRYRVEKALAAAERRSPRDVSATPIRSVSRRGREIARRERSPAGVAGADTRVTGGGRRT